jgi:phosphohistidine phosphatase
MLYLIRHASADERGPKYPDDSKRPLIEKGLKQSKALCKLFKTLEPLDQLFSSPYTRAAQTAEPLSAVLKRGNIHYLESLADGDYDKLIADIYERLEPASKTIALVGHEPYLSELASYLLSGQTSAIGINFRKAALMSLSGRLAPKQMQLEFLVPAALYKLL